MGKLRLQESQSLSLDANEVQTIIAWKPVTKAFHADVGQRSPRMPNRIPDRIEGIRRNDKIPIQRRFYRNELESDFMIDSLVKSLCRPN